MRLTVSETAKLSGVSVRTLHYYDEIGLLHPAFVNETGYRYYEDEQIEQLQEILFYRELEFSLKEISNILSQPNYNKSEAFKRQKDLLILKRNRINRLINLLNANLKGEKSMSFKEFDMAEIEDARIKYAKEVEKRWGNTKAYAECAEKTDNYRQDEWKKINKNSKQILNEFAKLIGTDPESNKAQELVYQWKQHITDSFYTCTDEILAGLGEMYVFDERFKKNIDKSGEGTSEFISEAIKYYCKKK